MANREIKTKVAIDGEKEYKESLKNINSALGTLKSELKLVESQYAGQANSYAALSAKGDVLSRMYDQQKEKVKAAAEQLEKAKKAQSDYAEKVSSAQSEISRCEAALAALGDETGDTTEEQAKLTAELEKAKGELSAAEKGYESTTRSVNSYQTQVNNAEAELNKLGSELDKNASYMDEAAKSSDGCAESIDEYGKEVKKAGEDSEEAGKKFDKVKTAATALGTAAAATAALAAAAIKLGKEVISAYADYEQLVGGVETLFKDSSGKVMEYANNAYKTAGLSANEYMETVTGFSASLISSLGGDTEKAAEYANMAITDMSDNANKMGSGMASIQNAYSGFAKQNYTMLDNLKLGYGGTKEEMQRLLEDAEKLSGVKYDTLLSDVLFQYHQCGGSGVKTADVLNYILARQTRQNWKLGACDFKRYFEYNWENSTLLAALFAVPECFDSEYLWSWDTTVYPWTLSLTVPTEALKSEIRYAKNMTNIKKTTDATSIANRVYALGYGEGVNQLTIESANGGVPYVEDALSIERYGLCSTILVDSRYQVAENLKAYAEQILAGLKEPYVSYEIGAIDLHRLTGDKFSKFRPGEIVRVVDEADGINLRTRIVRVEKADAEGDPGNVTVTIANKTQDIAGSISDLQSRALISETYAQGATNQQIYNFSDNADATHPAKLQLYISDSVVRINKMLLNIEFEAFRAYEKAIGGGGGQTTSSGGGQTTSSGGGQTTSSGGGSTTSSGGGQTSGGTALESSNVLPSETNGQAVHNHGISQHARLATTSDGKTVDGYETFVWSGAHTHPAHTHRISAHTHEVYDHTHTVRAHTHTVKDHTHTVKDHTHAIEFGIYEGQRASKATIKVDGKEIPAPSSYSNIDIVKYLATDSSGKIRRNSWHSIEILPDNMSRIVGAVFAQTFCNSRGGGDY